MTAENVMKMGPIHPEENRYNWSPADKIVNFAQKNGILLFVDAMIFRCFCPKSSA
jgi:GH35 family endo-1,4-beta-xylanase